ncbi:hypothetical protein BV20DRAFT_110829 [Pilatotrama ljubarskyi]|nr:hypothetical protein BV20DRAFT_110829 [Pilatotrama ljubarskyi]
MAMFQPWRPDRISLWLPIRTQRLIGRIDTDPTPILLPSQWRLEPISPGPPRPIPAPPACCHYVLSPPPSSPFSSISILISSLSSSRSPHAPSRVHHRLVPPGSVCSAHPSEILPQRPRSARVNMHTRVCGPDHGHSASMAAAHRRNRSPRIFPPAPALCRPCHGHLHFTAPASFGHLFLPANPCRFPGPLFPPGASPRTVPPGANQAPPLPRTPSPRKRPPWPLRTPSRLLLPRPAPLHPSSVSARDSLVPPRRPSQPSLPAPVCLLVSCFVLSLYPSHHRTSISMHNQSQGSPLIISAPYLPASDRASSSATLTSVPSVSSMHTADHTTELKPSTATPSHRTITHHPSFPPPAIAFTSPSEAPTSETAVMRPEPPNMIPPSAVRLHYNEISMHLRTPLALCRMPRSYRCRLISFSSPCCVPYRLSIVLADNMTSD